MQTARMLLVTAFFGLLPIVAPTWAGEEPGGQAESPNPRQYAIRHLDTPCAYYVMNSKNHEAALRITDARSETELNQALARLKQEPLAVLEALQIEDLSQVVVASVGAPLNGAEMREEASKVKQQLESHGLSNVPVRVFPKPFTFMQKFRAQFPLGSDWVAPTDKKAEADAQRRGLQITTAANTTTLVTLAFLGPSTGGVGWLLAVPPTTANLIIDYYVGKHRSSINNFLARSGNSRLSALFRDTQVSLVFAVPFYLIPRITDFVIHHANGDVALAERLLSMQLQETSWAVASGVTAILASALIHSVQIFTFMNPNAIVDKQLINEGTTLTEKELNDRNAWRVAGFFAISAPLFAAANHPSSPVAFTIPYVGLDVMAPQLGMAALATFNYLAYYARPIRMQQAPYDFYQRLGWFMGEVLTEWTLIKPWQGLKRAVQWLAGRPQNALPQSDEPEETP
jgi:hypothetical protein